MSSDIDSIYKGIVEQACPPMTLRIGVAGHRRLDKDQLPSLRQHLKNIYSDIGRLAEKAAARDIAQNIYAPDEMVIRFISALAEGADRLCIEPELMPFEYELAAILPFARAEYEKDFGPKSSVIDSQNGTVADFRKHLARIGFDEAGNNSRVPLIELDGDPSQRSKAYNDCAKVLVEHSDLLVAVYDGDLSKHIGTAATVRMAMERGVPVIHVSTLAPGKVTIHPSGLFEHDCPELAYTLDNLEGELNRLLLFTDVIDNNQQIIDRFRRYRIAEKLAYDDSAEIDFNGSGPIRLVKDSPALGSRVFSLFKKMMTRGAAVEKIVDEMNRATRDDVNPQVTTDKINSNPEDAVSSHRLYSAFLRADCLATCYANVHRSTFLLIYILGALALITAASALAFKNHHGVVLVLVAFELLLLGLIYGLFKRDHRRGYHNRWLEYRCLAEFFRPLVYMNFLGRSLALVTAKSAPTALKREFVGRHASARRWVYIYLVSVLRWAGFSYCPLNDEHKESVHTFIHEAWTKRQIDYHTHNASQMQVMGHRLRSFSFSLFFATIVAVLVKLGLLVAESFQAHFSFILTSTVGLLTAVFPILATMAFSIRNHAEFDISAQRSLSMRAVLLAHFKAHQKDSPHMTSERIYRELQRLADESINETAEWFEIYEVKETEPA